MGFKTGDVVKFLGCTAGKSCDGCGDCHEGFRRSGRYVVGTIYSMDTNSCCVIKSHKSASSIDVYNECLSLYVDRKGAHVAKIKGR